MTHSEARLRYKNLYSKVEKIHQKTVVNGCTIPEVETSQAILKELYQKIEALEKEFPILRILYQKNQTQSPPPRKPRPSDLEKSGYIILVVWPDYRVVFGASTAPWYRVAAFMREHANIKEAPSFFRTWKLRHLKEAKQLNLKLRKHFREVKSSDAHTLWTFNADLLEMLVAKLNYFEQLAKAENEKET